MKHESHSIDDQTVAEFCASALKRGVMPSELLDEREPLRVASVPED